ncbi:MAG: type II secretion system major pseudopilin GspG [Planctomycetaceae bacterium]|jgi:general secretion pathway protein G|nr:type II secretion system major pseudopilin GspG [Planctomycetaceae bacterium]
MKCSKKSNRVLEYDRKYASGFTLIEIMIVLFIMLSMMSAGVLAYNTYINNSRIQTTQQYITNVTMAIQAFNLKVGRNPSELQDLVVCPSNIEQGKWGEKYLDKLKETDPWGNEFRYSSPGQHRKDFDIWSSGPDGQDGTEDDIGNWTN